MQRGKLYMMLGQCGEAAIDFQRVIEYVSLSLPLSSLRLMDIPSLSRLYCIVQLVPYRDVCPATTREEYELCRVH
jgi:hypothetical protein